MGESPGVPALLRSRMVLIAAFWASVALQEWFSGLQLLGIRCASILLASFIRTIPM